MSYHWGHERQVGFRALKVPIGWWISKRYFQLLDLYSFNGLRNEAKLRRSVPWRSLLPWGCAGYAYWASTTHRPLTWRYLTFWLAKNLMLPGTGLRPPNQAPGRRQPRSMVEWPLRVQTIRHPWSKKPWMVESGQHSQAPLAPETPTHHVQQLRIAHDCWGNARPSVGGSPRSWSWSLVPGRSSKVDGSNAMVHH